MVVIEPEGFGKSLCACGLSTTKNITLSFSTMF